jgi:serine/threonine protein phosphatase PrpC
MMNMKKTFAFYICILFLSISCVFAAKDVVRESTVGHCFSFDSCCLGYSEGNVQLRSSNFCKFWTCVSKTDDPSLKNQDAFAVHEGECGVCFSIFDGHGPKGDEVAKLFAKQLVPEVIRKFYEKTISTRTFEEFVLDGRIADLVDEAVKSVESDELKKNKTKEESCLNCSGSTALMAFIKNRTLAVAGIGDSRVLLVKKEGQEFLSKEHKPNHGREKKRIEGSGGRVIKRIQTYRLCPPEGEEYKNLSRLAMSRSVGNLALRDFGLITNPSAVVHEITGEDLYLVLASDGLWDVLTKERVGEIVRDCPFVASLDIAQELLCTAYSKGSRDDITVIVVYLPYLLGSQDSYSSDWSS